jgi:hypothetical protein
MGLRPTIVEQLSKFHSMRRPRQSEQHKAGAGRAMGPRVPRRVRRPGFNFWSFPMSALFSPTALVVPFEN